MRKQFFRVIDSMLPRWVAKSPYLLALWVMRGVLRPGLGLKVWNRNSTKTNTFVFGISDLDLTILGKEGTSLQFLREALTIFKRLFIFLGETNYYDQEDLFFILKRMNFYELKRDPCLQRLSLEERAPSTAEKFVFIQRMLFSDIYSLKSSPELRQAKWRHHFELIGISCGEEKITLDTIVRTLKDLSSRNPRISVSIDLWISQVFKNDFNPYRSSFGEGFPILAPHYHLWFQEKDENDFLRSLNEFEKEIIQRQIDWEFWGLYTQRYHLKNSSVRPHLLRLVKVLSSISPSEAVKLQKEIGLVFQEN